MFSPRGVVPVNTKDVLFPVKGCTGDGGMA